MKVYRTTVDISDFDKRCRKTKTSSGYCLKYVMDVSNTVSNCKTASECYKKSKIHHDNIPNELFVYLWFGNENGLIVGAGHVVLGKVNSSGYLTIYSSNSNKPHSLEEEQKYLTYNKNVIGWSATCNNAGRLVVESDVL